jgi:hypothetical protein
MRNNFGTLMLDIKLLPDFDQALVYCKKVFSDLKTSLMPFGVLYMVKIPCILPFSLPKIIGYDITKKFSVIYSNVNASTKDYEFDGKKNLSHYFLIPGYGSTAVGFAICTVGNRLSIGMYADQSCMANP